MNFRIEYHDQEHGVTEIIITDQDNGRQITVSGRADFIEDVWKWFRKHFRPVSGE